MRSIIGILLLTFLFSSCQKETEPVVPPIEIRPEVKLISPTLYLHYHPGSEIIISGEAIAGAMLHGYDVMVFDRKTRDTLFHDNGHAHANRFNFSDTMVHDHSIAYEAQAYVKVYVNHDHDFIADSVDFYLLAQ